MDLERDTGAELGVLIERSCKPTPSSDYALQVFNQWGVGKSGSDNGVLLTLLIDDRRVEITPGDGYQQLFTRSRSQRLLERHVVPQLKAGKRGAAVVAGVQEIADRIRMQEKGISAGAVEAGRDVPPPPMRHVPSAPLAQTYVQPSGEDGTLVMFLGAVLGVPLVIGLFLFLRPKCPRCKKVLSVRRRVREAATYSRSGWGDKFLNCHGCGYKRKERYGIAQLTHATTTGFGGAGGSSFGGSGGSSFGGSSGSSFGGGSSSGGGGGASW